MIIMMACVNNKDLYEHIIYSVFQYNHVKNHRTETGKFNEDGLCEGYTYLTQTFGRQVAVKSVK
jgi:hypothetical protein